MTIENHAPSDKITVPLPRTTGFEASITTGTAPVVPSEDFSDCRVFVHLEPSMPANFGDLYHGQSGSGPTKTYITRNTSDAALVAVADRYGLALDGLRTFRDQAHVGVSMLATPSAPVRFTQGACTP